MPPKKRPARKPPARKRPVAKAKQFWETLASEAAELHAAVFSEGFEALRRAHARVGELLAAGSFSLLYEMTNEGKELVLLFTPEWNAARAAEIDWFISLAPTIPGWKLYNRRQRKDCDLAFDLLENALNAEARDARFTIEEVKGGVHITMYSETCEYFKDEYKEGCVRFFLSHAIGEQLMMDHVREVTLLPAAKPKAKGLLTPQAMVNVMLARAEVTR